MLDNWLKVLEAKKQQVVDRISAAPVNEEVKYEALYVANTHYLSVRHYLERIEESGFIVNHDLSLHEGIYSIDVEYRALANGVSNHLIRMQRAAETVEKTNCTPEVMIHFLQR